MDRGLNAPLSSNEEITLRRVALAVAPEAELPSRDLDRLRSIGLVEGIGSTLRLTALGQKRYAALPRASTDATTKEIGQALAAYVQQSNKNGRAPP